MRPPPPSLPPPVMDVGAAPGAWSEHVSAHVRAVLAIDPGALAPSVLARPNITHVRKKVRAEHRRRQATQSTSQFVCTPIDWPHRHAG